MPHEVISEPDRRKQIVESLDLDHNDRSESELEQLMTMVLHYGSLFTLNLFDLGATDLVAHSIDTSTYPPVHQPARQMPFSLCQHVFNMRQKVICPLHSPWASPVVLVQKKDGSLHFCVDYRCLNAITKLDVFQLPRIDDSLDLLANSRYFTAHNLYSLGK